MSGGVFSLRAAIGQQLGHSDPGQCVHISSPHTAAWLFPLSGHLRAALYHISSHQHPGLCPPSLSPVSAHQPSTFRAQHCRGAADLDFIALNLTKPSSGPGLCYMLNGHTTQFPLDRKFYNVAIIVGWSSLLHMAIHGRCPFKLNANFRTEIHSWALF